MRLPELVPILIKLNENRIKYGLFAGAYVSLATSNRIPTDVDLLIADDEREKILQLFSVNPVEREHGVFIYPSGKESIELSLSLSPKSGSKTYSFRLTPLAWKRTILKKTGVVDVRFCDPADTILLKAILQRGKEEGKHDLRDIKDLLKVVDIDKEYLRKRMLECNADERVFSCLKGFGLIA